MIRLGLALGGGAVRGAAHIGVLDVLDRAGLKPAVISGTSAGALVGALYAAGSAPADISKLAHTLRWARLVRPARTRKALFDTAKLGAFLDEVLGARDFDALDLPFAAVATELTSGARVVLRDGSVSTAVLASAAIPGVFPPVGRGDELLVDGSLTDVVPAGLARELGADIVVGVDVTGPLPRRRPTNLVQVMVAVSALQPCTHDGPAEQADLVLAPAVDEYAFWELSRIEEFEDAGREAAERALPLIRSLIETAEARRAWEQGAGRPY